MDWPLRTWSDWHTFVVAASQVSPTSAGSHYLFRGQSDAAWELRPTLLRRVGADTSRRQALSIEQAALSEFRSQAHLHLESTILPPEFPEPPLPEWWALMQHHGAPTRLLDWTYSPFVAAYFAAERHDDRDGAVFVVHGVSALAPFRQAYGNGSRISNSELVSSDTKPVLMFWTPGKRSQRLVAQQGTFSLSVDVLGVHDEQISASCATALIDQPAKLLFEKWLIPAQNKDSFMRGLRAMNITAHSLFPGVDGLGRSVSEFIRLRVFQEHGSDMAV